MALYVDRLIDYTGRVPYRHKVWCHLVADTDDELLAAAAELGAEDAWMQGRRGWDTHFDVPAPWRSQAVDLGAREVDFRFMALRTRSRRAALALGGDRAVGAPVGTDIEVPVAGAAPDWHVAHAPDGVAVAWRRDHPLLPGRAVAVLSCSSDRCGVVTLSSGSSTTAVAVAWSSRARATAADA